MNLKRNISDISGKFKMVDVSSVVDAHAHNRGKFISIYDSRPRQEADAYIQNKRVHDTNFAFFQTALANLHNELSEPMVNTTYAKDIPVKFGGGFVDYTSYYTVNYSEMSNNTEAISANNDTELITVNAGLDYHKGTVYTLKFGYNTSFVDFEKMKTLELTKSIQDIYQNIILAKWDLYVQKIAYIGQGTNKNGLFNHKNVLGAVFALKKGQEFKDLTDAEIVSIFNKIFEYYLTNSNMNLRILPDTFLVPNFVSTTLIGRMSALYTSSLSAYIKTNNLAISESGGEIKEITITMRPYLDKMGVANKGRIVAYKKDPKFVRLDMPYPLQHYITLPNMQTFGYTSAFVGQVSEIILPYNQEGEFGVVSYWDFTEASDTASSTGSSSSSSA